LELVEGPNLEKDDKENVTINIEMMETIHDDIMESIFQEINVNNDISSMVEMVRNAKIEVAKNTCPPLSLTKGMIFHKVTCIDSMAFMITNENIQKDVIVKKILGRTFLRTRLRKR